MSKRTDLSWRLRWTVVVLCGLAVVGAACVRGDDLPTLERRAQDLNKVIMCPLCPGESIDQSQAQIAIDMRAIVIERLEEGWTEEEIKVDFVDRFGPRVLMEPSWTGVSLPVWLVPPAGIVVAGAMLFAALRNMRRTQESQTEEALAHVQVSEDEREGYFRRIEAALAREENEKAAEVPRFTTDSESEDATC